MTFFFDKERPEADVVSGEPTSQDPVLTELEQAKLQTQEYKDLLMRARADLENAVKQAQKDLQHAVRYAQSDLLKEILTVPDNLERALSSLNATDPDAAQTLTALAEGVRMTLDEFHRVVTQFGVEKVLAIGEKFDPHLHQVITEEASETVEPGTVLRVIQNGYRLHDRLLRPALVIVAKKG